MKARLGLTLGLIVVLLGASSAPAADLSSAKALYAAASYEEALTMLTSLETTESLEPLNELRALCLLALGRAEDAERAVTQLVLHNPTYEIDSLAVSPKLVTLFHDVRRRTLPTAARALYRKAKSSYEEKRWADAKREFAGLIELLNDPDVVDQQAALADLRQLGEGFLKLSEVELSSSEARPVVAQLPSAPAPAATQTSVASPSPTPPTTAPAPARGAGQTTSVSSPEPAAAARAVPARATPASSTPQRGAPAPARPPIYTALDRSVTAPIEQRRAMPRWSPPNPAMAMLTATGLLEIVLDETGAVEQANILKPTTPVYDAALVDSARSWRYTPATKDGQPVRYRFVLQVVIRPPQ